MSTQPPSGGELPYGCTYLSKSPLFDLEHIADSPVAVSLDFDTDSHALLSLDQPERAPGNPLLDENESRYLHGFFDDEQSNGLGTVSFGEGHFEGDFFQNLPPNFLGTASHFGQPPAPSLAHTHSIPGMEFVDMSPTMMMPPPSRTNFQHAVENQLARGVSQTESVQRNGLMNLSVGQHQPMDEFLRDGKRISQSDPNSAFGPTSWMHPDPSAQTMQRTNQAPIDIQYGSDMRFGSGQSFVSLSERETSEALDRERMKYMDCLEMSQSAAPSPPSTGLNGNTLALNLRTRVPPAPVEAGDDADNVPTASEKTVKKRKHNGDDNTTHPPTENGGAGKRRKSSVARAAKQPRETLTKEQKQMNHIKSEQKRRAVIKKGFNGLGILVPGLRTKDGHTFSKSTMLDIATKWIVDLQEGNEQLKELSGSAARDIVQTRRQ